MTENEICQILKILATELICHLSIVLPYLCGHALPQVTASKKAIIRGNSLILDIQTCEPNKLLGVHWFVQNFW